MEQTAAKREPLEPLVAACKADGYMFALPPETTDTNTLVLCPKCHARCVVVRGDPVRLYDTTDRQGARTIRIMCRIDQLKADVTFHSDLLRMSREPEELMVNSISRLMHALYESGCRHVPEPPLSWRTPGELPTVGGIDDKVRDS